jgi:hypothetical protein
MVYVQLFKWYKIWGRNLKLLVIATFTLMRRQKFYEQLKELIEKFSFQNIFERNIF